MARPFSTGKFPAPECQVGLNYLDADKTQGVERKLLTSRVVTRKNLFILKGNVQGLFTPTTESVSCKTLDGMNVCPRVTEPKFIEVKDRL
jgi:hypothetical protein